MVDTLAGDLHELELTDGADFLRTRVAVKHIGVRGREAGRGAVLGTIHYCEVWELVKQLALILRGQ